MMCENGLHLDWAWFANDCVNSGNTFPVCIQIVQFLFMFFVFVCPGFRGLCPKITLTSRRNGQGDRLWLDVSVSVDDNVEESIDKTELFSWELKLRFKLILRDDKGQTLDFTFLPWPIQPALGQEFPRDDLLRFDNVFTLYIRIYEQPDDDGLLIPKKLTIKKFR